MATGGSTVRSGRAGRLQRLGGAAGAVAVALALAACGSSASRPMTPTAFVTSATQATLAQKTADVSLHGAVTAAGQSVPMTGTGQVDFTDNAMSMNVDTSAAGRAMTLRELFVGGHIFMGMTIAGQDLARLVGKAWIELPVNAPASGSGNLGSGNPVDQIRLLEAKGSTVVPKGTTTIDGTRVHGYAVTPAKAAMLAQVQKLSSTLTPAQIQQIESTIQSSPPPTFTVWFDGSQLLRRIAIDMQLAALGRGSGGGQIDMDFSNYGVPVHVTAPAASDVMPYSQFQQRLAQRG